MPLFALANAGIHIDGQLLGDAVTSPITLGIFFGYVVGKPLGIIRRAWLASARWPAGSRRLSWPVIAGGGVVAGIGFTVSLLISSIAFDGAAAGGGEARRARRRGRSRRSRAGSPSALIALSAGRASAPARSRARPTTWSTCPTTSTPSATTSAAPTTRRSRCRVRRLPVPLLRPGGGRDPRAARLLRRRAALRLAPPPAQRRAPERAAGGRGGRGGGRPGRVLGDARHAARPPGRAVAARPAPPRGSELGLDVERFCARTSRPRARATRIAEDVASADASGVAGTPTFFINGRRHEGAYDVADAHRAVRAARSRAAAGRARATI